MREDWASLAAAMPATVLAVLTAVWLAMAVLDRHPFWPYEPLNLSEAAALRDAGEVAKLLADGHDPTARYPVRGGFLTQDAALLTPLEAAIAADRPEIVEILVGAGAALPGHTSRLPQH